MKDHRVRAGNPMVDASPAIDHVRALVGKGMPLTLIVERAEIAQRMVYGFYHGYLVRQGMRKPIKKTSQSTLKVILAVEFEEGWSPESFSPEKFRGIRESRNLSRRGLAKLSGLTEWTFQYWEEGRSKPTRRKNMEAALAVLQVEWQDVSGPLQADDDDEFEQTFTLDPFADLISDYACHVCGGIFRSRKMLAEHPHVRKKVGA